jgi:hypothetical protein
MRIAKGILPDGAMAKSRSVFERLEAATAEDILRFYRKSEAMGSNADRAH